MSNLIQPWIRTYLTSVAETHGGDLLQVPLEPSNKRVQAIKVRLEASSKRIISRSRDKNALLPSF